MKTIKINDFRFTIEQAQDRVTVTRYHPDYNDTYYYVDTQEEAINLVLNTVIGILGLDPNKTIRIVERS